MQRVEDLIKETDASKIKFYIENNELIIELYRKRGLSIVELVVEHKLLRDRYKEITGKEYRDR